METINAVWEHSYGEDCIPNFSANMEQPRHRWYEFKEGFSLTLVERAIRETKKDNKSTSFTVLDPFSGSGTSPLTALQSRCNAIGYEVNPFMSFVGKTKCQQRTKSIHDYTKELNRILVQRPFRLKSPLEGVSTFTGSGENGKWLFNLDVLRAYEALYQHISLSEYKDFFLLALITSAMQCCNAKKDGKCLRYLKNWKALNYTGANLRDTFKANALQMISDLERSPLLEGTRDITQGDTRKLLQASEHDSADLIIFSPPYLNSFDYSDIYRPELFLGKFVKDNSELMQLRKQTLRSHVQCKWDRKDSSTSPWVTGIVQKLTAKQDTLWNANIPQMVSSYFYDMEEVLKQSSMLDRETVERLLQNNLDAKLNSELSKYGYQLDAAHKLFRFITSIFERTPPELITWKFKVIMPVGDWDFSQKIILNFHRMNEVFTSECAFIIVDSNLYLIEPYEADYSGRDHICYQYNAPQNESLTIKDKQFQLSEYYDSAITSIFAQPTYKELDEAMDYYNTRYVRDSSCAVLSQIWTDEAKREFVQKPEHFMRDSLWQCLQNILRNHTVKREQIVDATHPVDIKVTWPAINNVALIEVKWLGDSGQTQYRDARANEGAKQLIDYLASSVQEEPDKHFVGYLTVFDGRRGKTSNQYERQEINYRSEYSSHPSMNYRRFYMAESV